MEGNGTQANPYLIYTIEDLLDFGGCSVADTEIYAKLMNDIDAAQTAYKDDFPGIVSPIKFYMNFDGQGYAVKNLISYGKPGNMAFFKCRVYGNIRNIRLENVSFTRMVNSEWIAGFAFGVGDPSVLSNVYNVHISGSLVSEPISGLAYGFCYYENYKTTFMRCSTNCYVSGGRVSGFFQRGSDGNIILYACVSSCSLQGYYTGGFVQYNGSTVAFYNCISNCRYYPLSKDSAASYCSAFVANGDGSGRTRIYCCYARDVLARFPSVPGRYAFAGLTYPYNTEVMASFYDIDILLSEITAEQADILFGSGFILQYGRWYSTSTEKLKDREYLMKQGWAF